MPSNANSVATVLPTTERIIVGPFTFHELALVIAGGSAAIAILFSFFLIMMHATHYTVPNEQKQYVSDPLPPPPIVLC